MPALRARSVCRAAVLALLTALLLFAPAAASAEVAGEPLDIDLEEHVDVQLVLIDAVVFDRRGATVGGLEAADFDLLVDNKDVEVASLDVDCPQAGAPDPPVGATRPDYVPEASALPRRYVFVMDYYHPGRSPVETLEMMRDAVLRLHVPGEQYMLISLGQVLRIEVPFTADPGEFARGIERMIHDPDLYAGFYERLTERRWFSRILTLLDVTERMPGFKSVVLFSGPFLEDGWTYDETFWEIAAMSGRSRTAFYPVDSRGLVPGGGILGPRMLGRLAVETGGRATAATNDLGRGFARAQRDQGCRYTVGFYDERPKYDRDRKVRLFVRRPGHRVAHPTFYVVRSEEAKHRSLVRSAGMLPSMFPDGGLSAQLVPLRPHSDSRWVALAAVKLEPEILQVAPADAEWTVKGTLRRMNGTIHQRFKHRFTVSDEPPAGPEARVELSEEIRPKPGSYTLNVVLSSPGGGTPRATSVEVVLPPIDGAFMSRNTRGELLSSDTSPR